MKILSPMLSQPLFLGGTQEVLVQWGGRQVPRANVHGEEKANKAARRDVWTFQGWQREFPWASGRGTSVDSVYREADTVCEGCQGIWLWKVVPLTKHFPGAHWKFKFCTFLNLQKEKLNQLLPSSRTCAHTRRESGSRIPYPSQEVPVPFASQGWKPGAPALKQSQLLAPHSRGASCPLRKEPPWDGLDSRAVPPEGFTWNSELSAGPGAISHVTLTPAHGTAAAESRDPGEVGAWQQPQSPRSRRVPRQGCSSAATAAARGDVLQSSLPFSTFP